MNCPNCQKELDKEIKSKAKSPLCQKFIYVRKDKLLSEGDLILYNWGERMIMLPEYYKIIDEEREIVKQITKMKPSARDIIWKVFNRLSLFYMKKQDLEQLSLLYIHEARFLDEEGKTEQAEKMREVSKKMSDKHYDLIMKNLDKTSFNLTQDEDEVMKCPRCRADMGLVKFNRGLFGTSKKIKIRCPRCDITYDITRTDQKE